MIQRSFLLLFLPLFLIRPGALQGETLQDDWARVLMGQNQIGYFHVEAEKVQEDGKDIFITSEETSFSMQRAGVVLNISEKAQTREDESGKVLSFKMERRMGGDLMEVSGKLEEGKLQLLANGMPSSVAYPEGALGPRKIDAEMRKAGFVPGTKSSFAMFNREDPGLATTLDTMILKKETLKIGGEEKEWMTSVSSMSHMPGMRIKTWANDEGDFEMIEMPLGGLGTIQMYRSSKEEALQQVKPAEMFTNTLIVPSRPIPEPQKLKEAVYLLRTSAGSGTPFISDVGQKSESQGNGVYKVTVTLPVRPPAEAIFKDAPLQDPSYAPYLKPSPYLQSNDSEVMALAKQIAGTESNALTLAQRIQQGVYMKISKKNLGTGFAAAATVAKTLEGDCTEHAVLSAAIARALGLPSRVVMGMVYAPTGSMAGNFGYHMWAEVLVAPNVWWPVDAAFGRYDVTHIAMVKSPMDKAGFESELVGPLLQVMGDLKIEVVETK